MAAVLCVVVFMSSGQLMFKIAADQASKSGTHFVLSLLFNQVFVAAVFLYGLATFLWIYVLSIALLSKAYSWMALSFALTPMLAVLVLSEPLTSRLVIGTVIIFIGIAVVNS